MACLFFICFCELDYTLSGQILIHPPEGLLRHLWPLWLGTVTVWLKARDTVAETPCKCG